MIGDTPNDVRCARAAIGAFAVAVADGGLDPRDRELAAANRPMS